MNSNTATLMQNTFGSPSEVWTGEPALLDPVPVSQQRTGKPQSNQRRLTSKRLTVDISGELHIRVKLAAVSQATTLNNLIRDMLEQRFPANR
jgi:hypothetical protein